MRVFFKTGSTVSEITKEIGRYKSETYLLTFSAGDYLYISTDFPLNHFYVKIGDVVNLETAALSIDYWSNEDWKPVVNINDYTDAFSNSGFIEFTPDRDENWTLDDTNDNGNFIDGLEDIVVYDQYWTRIKVNNNLTSGIELQFIGNIFSDDEDLYAEYPIFDDAEFLSCFDSGKTDWQEQHAKAAELMIQDLKRKKVILGAEQILDRDILRPASVCKVAEIIYKAFGKDYTDQLADARIEYGKRIDLSQFIVDKNNNAIKEHKEVITRQGFLRR